MEANIAFTLDNQQDEKNIDQRRWSYLSPTS